jgi:hypothetical protein
MSTLLPSSSADAADYCDLFLFSDDMGKGAFEDSDPLAGASSYNGGTVSTSTLVGTGNGASATAEVPTVPGTSSAPTGALSGMSAQQFAGYPSAYSGYAGSTGASGSSSSAASYPQTVSAPVAGYQPHNSMGFAPFGMPSFQAMGDTGAPDFDFGELFGGMSNPMGGNPTFASLGLSGEQSVRQGSAPTVSELIAGQHPQGTQPSSYDLLAALQQQQYQHQHQQQQYQQQQEQQRQLILSKLQQFKSFSTGGNSAEDMQLLDAIAASLASGGTAGAGAGLFGGMRTGAADATEMTNAAGSTTAALRRAAQANTASTRRMQAGLSGSATGSKVRSSDSTRPTTVAQSLATNKRFPRDSTKVLKEWLFKNSGNPYPSEATKNELMAESGLTLLQLNNWFINARRRLLIKKRANGGRDKAEFKLRSNAAEL